MIYNKFLEEILLPIGDLVNRSSFMAELKRWRRIQHLSSDQLSRLQHENLRKVLSHTAQNIPYYQKLNIQSGDNVLDDLHQFPVIDKIDIKSNLREFLGIDQDRLIPHSSSGSSGIQGTIYMNKQEQSITRAVQTLWWEWAGYKIGEPLLQTGITPQRGILKAFKDVLFRTRYVPAFGHSESSMLDILKACQNNPPKHFGGYASSLYHFAKIAGEHHIKLEFDSVFSWGDKLFDHYREEIRKAFDVEVNDTYGVSEGMMIAAQKDLPYYYIMTPHVYLEILDEEGMAVPDGEMGYIVVTRLDAYSMPLIRYKLGDLGIKLPISQYPKDRQLQFPLLERIVGRDTDVIRTAANNLLIVHFFTGIFEHIPEIRQFQVIQRGQSELTIKYIPDTGFQASILENVRHQIVEYLQEELIIEFEETAEIKPTASGKPQMIKIEMDAGSSGNVIPNDAIDL